MKISFVRYFSSTLVQFILGILILGMTPAFTQIRSSNLENGAVGSYVHRSSEKNKLTRDGQLAISSDVIILIIQTNGGDQTPIISNANLYQQIEQSMTNNTSFSNPLTETELRLEVKAPPGRALGSSFIWYGFYDGDGVGGQNGNVWKFRLLLDRPGAWTVNAGFYVPGTNTSNGPNQTYQYNVSTNKVAGEHGHIRVDPQNFLRLSHDDGTSWVPFAVHSSMLLDRDQTLSKQWIDEHAARGVDALAARFHAEAYDLGDPPRFHFIKNGDQYDYDRYDIAAWNYNEAIIEYAQSKGVKLSIWFGMSGINPQYESYGPRYFDDNTTLGPEQKAFIKYFLARWATYTNFWHWTVDSEYEETGEGALDRNRTYAAELRAQNPWRTLVTTHVLRDWTPGNSPEFDLVTLQRRVGGGDDDATDCQSFVTDNDDYNIPVYNAEGVWNLPTRTHSRIASMTHVMAGGFSKIAHYDSGPLLNSSWGVTWNSVLVRHQEDVEEMGKLANFFNKTSGININPCQPRHELVTVSRGNLAFCLAKPGESYYIWVDRGGTPSLDLASISGNFTVTRYRGAALTNPVTLPSISGGGIRNLGATPTTGFGNDYLYVVTRINNTATITIIAPNGGESWTAGGTAMASCSSAGAIANVKINLSTDGGSTYPAVLAANTPNDGGEIINVPAITTAQARIGVSDESDNSIADFSNANFTITNAMDVTPPVVTITSPGSDSQTFKGNIAISGTATDDAGIAMVQWQLDATNGPWNTASAANAWNFSIPQPADSSHTVYVRATDIATPANTSAPVSRNFVADNTGPLISNIQALAGQTSARITWLTNEASDSRVQWGAEPNNYTGDTFVVETGVIHHTVTLNNLAPATTYHFIVMSSDAAANPTVSADLTFTLQGPISDVALSEIYDSTLTALLPSYPNPFNLEARIVYQLPKCSHVKLVIRDLEGREVKLLANEEREAGTHAIQWDGRDDSGNPLPSGIYIYSLQTENFRSAKKLLLVK